MSGPVLQAPLHSPPIIQQLITKQTSPLMSFVLAWSDDLSVDLSDLIWSLIVEEKTEQNKNPNIYSWCSIPLCQCHFASHPSTKELDLSWLSLSCLPVIAFIFLSYTKVLKIFARLKKVSSFQWISNLETIWIDKLKLKSICQHHDRKGLLRFIYIKPSPINIYWQLKFNDLENVKIESFRLV